MEEDNNPGEKNYEDRFDGLLDAEENPDSTNEIDENDKPGSWSDNTTGRGRDNTSASKASRVTKTIIKLAKNKGVAAGGISIGGLLLILLFVTLAPASLLFSLSENIFDINDSSSAAMERRFFKVFTNMNNPNNDPICAGSTRSVTIRCKMGRISNSALHSLSKKGVVADFGDKLYDGKKTGYPEKNPRGYKFTTADGKERFVKSEDLLGFLNAKENRQFAALILGSKGAFNLKTKAWMGKHISKKLYKKFNLARDGGLADGKNSGKLSTKERLQASFEKLNKKIPGMQSADNMLKSINKKAENHLGKAKKGGPAYLTSVAACVGIKAPSYVAAGVAAVQLAQVIPYFIETIGGPASKAKNSFVGSGFTGEDMDAVGTMLTEKVDGKSALDSPVLLAAMGANKGKPAVPASVSPGFSILTSPAVIASREVGEKTEPACNAIMSPTAMYTAMAADIAITAAASATVLGGIIKIGASLLVGEVATRVATYVIENFAKDAIIELAQNDAIPKARGMEFGDVLGVSAQTFFSTGGLGRHLPVMSASQNQAFVDMQKENIQFEKEMDIASLSPFDTSSKYTFLGSILHNSRMAVLTNGGASSLTSVISSLASLPFTGFSKTASAAGYDGNYGSYASDFKLEVGSGDQPCITVSGMPCTGITPEQSSISTEQAIQTMISEGWVDETKTSSPSATLDEMIGGVIKKDTLLSEFMETCSNPETGDYLFNAAGCMVASSTADYSSDTTNIDIPTEDGGTIKASDLEDVSSDFNKVGQASSIAAMTPFLLDYQIAQSLNGEDEEESESTSSVEGALVGDKAFPIPDGSVQNGTTYDDHGGVDFASSEQLPIFAVADGVVKVASDTCPNTPDKSCGGQLGNHVIISHSETIDARYLHMMSGSVLVKTGDAVKAGQRIGTLGNSGYSTGPHLHFDIWENGARIGDQGTFNWLKHYGILPSRNKDTLIYD